ncbi:MAG: molybdopterin-binding protein [Paracoccus sp. (in: a-proteobacteria)]
MRKGRRVLLGADFAFGYPAGFARRVAGDDRALSLWEWLAERITNDALNQSNFREIAGQINLHLGGNSPFWGNGLARDVPGLPRKKPPLPDGLDAFRETEGLAAGPGGQPKSVWQLAGAGCVGAQTLTGIVCLAGLRQRFAGDLAVWPFEPIDRAQVILVEIYPSIISAAVKASKGYSCPDEAQVSLLAKTFAALDAEDALMALFCEQVSRPFEEGQIFGAGDLPALQQASERLVRPVARTSSMPPGVDWLPVDEAQSRLRAALSALTGSAQVATAEARGRVLAEDARARRSNPPRANSAVDGFGFAHATAAEAMPLAAGRAAAGQPFDGALPGGQAVKILTGAILPEGVDTVILQEESHVTGDAVRFDRIPKRGANTRMAGEDMAEGALALPAGRRLVPADLALASALGIGRLTVRPRLRVGVLSTGDEIVARPDLPALPHQIWDANRPMLLALAQGWAAEAVDLGHAPDDPAAIAAALDRGARDCDLILTSGGASAGDEDHVSRLLSDRGELTAWRIAMKPGRPLALAFWNRVPVIGLPGNPVAALVCALIFARPAAGLIAGEGWREPLAFTVPAAFAKSKRPGRREYLRARLNAEGAAEVFGSEGSGRISGLSWAEGLVELPDGAAEIAPGTPVRYLPFAHFQ